MDPDRFKILADNLAHAVAVEREEATPPLERIYSNEGELVEIREHGVTTWTAAEGPRPQAPQNGSRSGFSA